MLEELIYRGVVQRRLEPYGARLAVGLSALCFGLVHHDLYQGLSAFLGGLVFGYAALTYGLGLSIGLHIAGNTLAMALPLLREAGTPGALAMLVLLALPGVAAAAGGIRLALRRRRAPAPSVPAARQPPPGRCGPTRPCGPCCCLMWSTWRRCPFPACRGKAPSLKPSPPGMALFVATAPGNGPGD